MINTYKIAGHVFALDTVFDETHNDFKDYQCDGEPEFTIKCTKEYLKTKKLAILEKNPENEYSYYYLEKRYILFNLSINLLDRNCMKLHSSALSYKGQGVLFTAPSGTGKSTHSRLWREAFGNDVIMVNDDMPYLSIEDDVVLINGYPYMGKHKIGNNMSVKLKAIVILRRGEENKIVPISRKDAFKFLATQTAIYGDNKLIAKSFSLLDKITNMVDLYYLECNTNDSAAKICCEKIFN